MAWDYLENEIYISLKLNKNFCRNADLATMLYIYISLKLNKNQIVQDYIYLKR